MRYLLRELHRDTTIHLIRTGVEHLHVARPQEPTADVLARLPEPLKVVPVVEDGRLRGVALRRDLRSAAAGALVREVMRRPSPFAVPRSMPIADALERFREGEPLVVVHRGRIDGIVTLADLNRRAFRVLLYALVAELEGRLADALRAYYPAPEDCYRQILPRMGKVARKRWASDVRAGVATHPTEILDLSDLVEVFSVDSGLRKVLALPSRKKAERELNGLVHLRNAVMHPVRPLVRGPADVERLIDRLARLRTYWERTEAYGVKKRRPGPRPSWRWITPRRTRGSPRRPRPRS